MTEIQKLYERIPKSVCRTGCVHCCINMIQMAPEEMERIGGYDYVDRCPHLTDRGCDVYENRPFICRLYGSGAMLHCDGCISERQLDDTELMGLLHEYLTLKKQQEDELNGRKRTLSEA